MAAGFAPLRSKRSPGEFHHVAGISSGRVI
jgi:hypothetical protein